MRAARLHQPGQPLRIDSVERPAPGPRDVLIEVMACGVIPNMNAIFGGGLWNRLPPLPAIVGLDAAGIVAGLGSEVTDAKIGDRVYVNPWLSCGACAYCRGGQPMLCATPAFQGYFGFFPESVKLLERYPYGGFAQFMTAASERLVHLPETVGFDHAARFGYIGTAFGGLRFAGVGAGSWVLINGVTGTLGVAATLLSLGMGATRILGLGRNRALLARLKALDPRRIDVLALGDAPIRDWVLQRTDGLGADVLLDCVARSAPASTTLEAVDALKRGGVAIEIGALTEPLPVAPMEFMTSRRQFRGSNWFTTGEGQLLAEMVATGVLDLGSLTTRGYPLDAINDAFEDIRTRPGGFTNIVVNPNR
jgi:alcohol dehydrogenase